MSAAARTRAGCATHALQSLQGARACSCWQSRRGRGSCGIGIRTSQLQVLSRRRLMGTRLVTHHRAAAVSPGLLQHEHRVLFQLRCPSSPTGTAFGLRVGDICALANCSVHEHGQYTSKNALGGLGVQAAACGEGECARQHLCHRRGRRRGEPRRGLRRVQWAGACLPWVQTWCGWTGSGGWGQQERKRALERYLVLFACSPPTTALCSDLTSA